MKKYIIITVVFLLFLFGIMYSKNIDESRICTLRQDFYVSGEFVQHTEHSSKYSMWIDDWCRERGYYTCVGGRARCPTFEYAESLYFQGDKDVSVMYCNLINETECYCKNMNN